MKERPILFSAPMVRALLAGAKTQTRRVVKAMELRGGIKGVRVAPRTFCYLDFDGVPGLSWRPSGGNPTEPLPRERVEAACPYGRPGDRLWVKETWAAPPSHDDTKPSKLDALTPVRFAADGVVKGVSKRFVDADGVVAIGKTRPSIFMPRWASRLTLEVTGVRVERMRVISEEDAKAEGVERDSGRDVPAAMGGGVETWRDYEMPGGWRTSAADSFRTLWTSINGAGSWAANPWVWVVSFKRVTP